MMCKTDPSIHSVELVKNIGVNFLLGYQRTKKIGPISSRDVYINVIWNYLENGSILTVVFNQSDNDFPLKKGCVRMKVPISGFYISPDPSNNQKCSIINLLEVSMEGKIPGYVMKAAIKD